MAPITGAAKLTSSSSIGNSNDPTNVQIRPFQSLEDIFRVSDATTATLEERSKKRRKLDDGKSVGRESTEAFDPTQSAKLVQIELDLHLPDRSEPFQSVASRTSVALSLESFERKPGVKNTFALSLWNTSTWKSAYIEATAESEVLDQVTSHLNIAASLAQTREGRKKSGKPRIPFARCTLHAPASGQKSLRLEVELRWSLGQSVVERQGARANTRDDLAILKSYWPPKKADAGQSWALSDFYDAVYTPSTHEEVPPRLEQSLTDTKLYPFQQRAVNWLLHREGVEISATGGIQTMEQALNSTPISFDTVQDAEGQICHISHMRGMVVRDKNSVWDATKALRGGILAEEMGLGKTVELIALMSLHRRKMPEGDVFDSYLGANVKPSTATLIISPPSILEQWKNEINAHAPELKVFHYKGLPPASAAKKDHEEATLAHLMQFDVVLTTYNVLSKEIHFATPPPDRSLRKTPVHKRKKSPLTEIGWWRVCLDEAQMVESGVSQAATVARIIPRINAWAVSGTPLRKDVQDLRGLLIFLRYEPFASTKVLWDRLDKASFRDIFNGITLRHTKDTIRHELRLPPQKRVVITCPFTAIEEQNYSELIRQMCDACWMSPEGVPTRDDKAADDPEVLERMREWLVRLRQTCLHAHVGKRNRRALGARNGPLRTIHEVLEVMIEQNDAQLKTEAREMMVAQMCRGHIRAYAKDLVDRSKLALPYYEEALTEAQNYVKMCRKELAAEQARIGLKVSGPDDAMVVDDDGEEEQIDKNGRVTVIRRMLRSFLEVEHACKFFIGSSYFQIKENDQLTKPDSPEFSNLQVQEETWYGKAKEVRQELLKESQDRALRHMEKIKKLTAKAVQDLPDLEDLGGIESRKILELMDQVTEVLNDQASQLLEWRRKIVGILTSPLVDQDEGKEMTGDEYEDSTKVQDELYVYLMALRTLIADRNTAVNGLQDFLVDHELKEAEKKARDEDPAKRGHAPELVLEVAEIRRKLQPKAGNGSLKGAISLARSIITNLQWRLDAGDSRAATELSFAEKYLVGIQKIATEQAKVVAELEKEQELFRTTMNCRLEFYRQLQHISDSVAPWKEELDEVFDYPAYERYTETHKKKTAAVKALQTKHKFLSNMRDEGNLEYSKPECIICQDEFEIGVLTSCGHRYCKGCIQQWWHEHRTCPLCKNKLHSRDFKDISFKPSTITNTEENQDSVSPYQPDSPSSAGTSSIYSDMSDSTMQQIKSINLDGSYGTKVDMIARHLLWIRNNDPGAKTIIFSQFADFLDVLRNAFKKWKIGASGIRDKNGIQQFRNDPAIECFLLDAKSDSSGLNLVNATYVFLCEPLINPAIELQAIARVHRIGQQRATTVFMYLVSDTVEEAIYDISVSRRLEHIGRNSTSASTSTSMPTSRATSVNPPIQNGNLVLQEKTIDKANSREMEAVPLKQLLRKKGDGEVVAVNDLWKCLFGGKEREKKGQVTVAERDLEEQQQQAEEETTREVDMRVESEVRARAAEERQLSASVRDARRSDGSRGIGSNARVRREMRTRMWEHDQQRARAIRLEYAQRMRDLEEQRVILVAAARGIVRTPQIPTVETGVFVAPVARRGRRRSRGE